MNGGSEIDKITDKIYLGNYLAAKDKNNLINLGVTHILVVGYYLTEYFPNDFVYKTIEIEDNENEDIKNYIIPVIDFIDNGKVVFIHCRAGVSRSSSFAIAYLMLKMKLGFEEAKQFVKSKRSKIEPIPSFECQLKELNNIFECCNYNYNIFKEFIKGFVNI